MNFRYYMPTKVIVGDDCIKCNAQLLSAYGKKAMLVTGRTSAKVNGAQQDVIEALEKEGVEYYVFDEVEQNPSILTVRRAAKVANELGVEFIVGIGGGSPLDAAKAIALLVKNELNDTQLFGGSYLSKPLPVIAVPTTAGTGSEVTQYAVLTDDNIKSKSSISCEHSFPVIAFLDAKYTKYLSFRDTINTAIDALSHCIEGYLCKRASAMSDVLALEGMNIIGGWLLNGTQQVEGEGSNILLSDREALLYASMLGGMVIANTGTTALHSIGYQLTYNKGIEHGRANGLLMYQYLKLIDANNHEKVNNVLRAIGINSLEQLKELLKKFISFDEDMTAEEFERYSSIAVKAKNMANTLTALDIEDINNIYRNSKRGSV